jgi:hypothetical protein
MTSSNFVALRYCYEIFLEKLRKATIYMKIRIFLIETDF